MLTTGGVADNKGYLPFSCLEQVHSHLMFGMFHILGQEGEGRGGERGGEGRGGEGEGRGRGGGGEERRGEGRRRGGEGEGRGRRAEERGGEGRRASLFTTTL